VVRVIEPGHPLPHDRLLDHLLQQAHVLLVVGRHEAHGVAGRGGATGAADAVHVVLGVHREVEVDDVRDALDVDAARGDVGRDEHARVSALERVERLDALALAAVRVNRRRVDAGLLELARDLVGAVLGAREDQHRVERFVAEQMQQEVDLAALRHGVEHLLD